MRRCPAGPASLLSWLPARSFILPSRIAFRIERCSLRISLRRCGIAPLRTARPHERMVEWQLLAHRTVCCPATRQSLAKLSGHQHLILSPRPNSRASDLSIRPRHFEHGVGTDFEVVASAACARDGTRERRLVDALLDEG